MLDGLEAVEIKLSKTQINGIFRIDSEHYKKIYLSVKKTLSKHKLEILANLVANQISTGHTPSMKNEKFYGGTIKFIKTDNLRDNYIKPNFDHYLSELGNKEIERTQLKKDDVIVTIIGATQKIVGRATKIDEKVLPANINQNIALIRADRKKINPNFINIYLNSYYGKQYLYYLSRQTEQVNLNCEEIGRVQVPIFSDKLQIAIETLVILSHQKLEDSKSLYNEAEILLLKELNLLDFTLNDTNTATKTFKESFGQSGRLDSEYYQPKYEDFFSLITSYSGGFELFSTACIVKDENFIPEDQTKYKYIELANIGKLGEITDCTTALGKELPTRARRKVTTNDVIISSIEGSLDSCALILPRYNNALCSTGFYVVNSRKLNPETLLVLFKSEPIQALFKKGCSGTILTAINKTELDQIPIPLIDSEVQKSIKEKINKYFELRQQSKQLLEVAKKAVEIAIEQDENAALLYINTEGNL